MVGEKQAFFTLAFDDKHSGSKKSKKFDPMAHTSCVSKAKEKIHRNEGALDTRMQEMGTSPELQAQLHNLIRNCAKAANIQSDESTDILELLKKVEIAFEQKYEFRDCQVKSAGLGDKVKRLEEEIHAARKKDKLKKTQAAQKAEEALKKEKQEEKANKQLGTYIAGKKKAERSSKPVKISSKKEVEVVNQDQKDQEKFLGFYVEPLDIDPQRKRE